MVLPCQRSGAAFSANCSMRDTGTHLCVLPTGEHCPKGLVTRAQEIGEPAGQIAARELEIERIHSALRRAEELSSDVAAAIEAAAN
jgi:hypothetical protein